MGPALGQRRLTRQSVPAGGRRRRQRMEDVLPGEKIESENILAIFREIQ